ncbi:MAG: hypothetical protein WB784_06790 [Rhodanobacteraceae bacterium]
MEQFTSGEELLLSDIRLAGLFGQLCADSYGDFFVVRHTSIAGVDISSDVFAETPSTITRLSLQPRNSRLSFKLHSVDPRAISGSELVYHASTCARTLPPFDITLDGQAVTITLRQDRAFVRSATDDLERYEEKMRVALGILCGGPASSRLKRSKDVVDINSAPHDTHTVGRFWKREEDIPDILQRTLQLLTSQTDAERRHQRAAHFYTHGLGDRSMLEHRIVLLYTALEVLDKSDTLSKEPVAQLLGVDLNSADLIIRVRNGLVHKGLSLGAAVEAKAQEIQSHSRTWSPHGLDLLRPRLGPHFFLWLATLLAKYWRGAIGFSGEISDYSSLA